MKILIACEESQAVCIEFRRLGFEAYSCDILPCSGRHPEWHIQGDAIKEAYSGKYDMMIGHPPCTYLSYAGIRWFNVKKYHNIAIERINKMNDALNFFFKLWNAPIKHICLENPRGFVGTFLKPDQSIHPYYFGDEASKYTHLWLKNLPNLSHVKEDNLFDKKTHVFKGEMGKNGGAWQNTHEILSAPKEIRSKLRSKTFPGIAKAMATQWGEYLNKL